MGDRTTAYFELGGKLTREAYDELLELIEQENYLVDPDNWTPYEPPHLKATGTFRIAIEEANYARVDPFDTFAQRHCLPYHHWWESGGGYGPGGFICIPGEFGLDYAGTMDGPALAIGELKRMTHSEILDWIERVERPLPPLEFDF